jgi:hypothetical protein
MKVRSIFETGTTRVVLIAETEAEMRMLGVLGTEMAATAIVHHEGHASYKKVSSIQIELTPKAGEQA